MAELVEPPSLETLYTNHHGWLQAWLRRRLGCSHRAADLAQDTFVRILSAGTPGDIREPRAYLSTIAKGVLINWYRRQALERAYLDALAAQPECEDAGPEQQALVVEALCEIDAILRGLPIKVRQAFLLSQLEGLKYDEIAARLGVSLSMVKKYMLQAITHCLRAQ